MSISTHFYVVKGLFTIIILITAGFNAASAQQGGGIDLLSEIQQDFEKRRLDLDRKILYQVYASFEPEKLPGDYKISTDGGTPVKCGFPSLIEYHRNKQHLSPTTVETIESIVQASHQAEFTYTSPGGNFVVHYDTSGDHAVPPGDGDGNGIPDYVDWVAAAADSSWRHEVGNLGYADPVAGVTDPYPVYIENVSVFGLTDYGYKRGYDNSTFIIVNSELDTPAYHNNEDDNKTHGAIKVTLAHELKHAIQYANSRWYGYPNNSLSPHGSSWTESDATLMEEVVYDNVNDYYSYLENPASIFLSNNHTVPASYYGVSWPLYFLERYGDGFWPEVWRRIKQRYDQEKDRSDPDYLTMVEAVSATLETDFGTTFGIAFAESQLWHYASGTSRSREGYGFEERLQYPDPGINISLLARDSLSQTETVLPMSADYIEGTKTPELEGYVQALVDHDNPQIQIGLIGYFRDGSVRTLSRSGNSSGELTVTTSWEWVDIQNVGLVVANPTTSQSNGYRLAITSDIPENVILTRNYPNPFNPGTTIEFGLPRESRVELRVYDAVGRLVSTLRDEIMPAGYYTIPFNGASLASGVYFYRLVTDRKTVTRKMTLIK